MIIFTQPQAKCDTRAIFKRIPLPIVGSRDRKWIHAFPKSISTKSNTTNSSGIWTQVADSILYNNNRYTKCASLCCCTTGTVWQDTLSRWKMTPATSKIVSIKIYIYSSLMPTQLYVTRYFNVNDRYIMFPQYNIVKNNVVHCFR